MLVLDCFGDYYRAGRTAREPTRESINAKRFREPGMKARGCSFLYPSFAVRILSFNKLEHEN